MHLELPLSLSPFGWASLEARAGADGFELDQLVEQACAHYASELGAGRPATDLPRFDPEEPDGRVRTVSLELDQSCVERLDEEAQRQGGVSRARHVRHATLMYLADLEAGRVADRLAERVQD
jgi:predicted DNA-binding protein